MGRGGKGGGKGSGLFITGHTPPACTFDLPSIWGILTQAYAAGWVRDASLQDQGELPQIVSVTSNFSGSPSPPALYTCPLRESSDISPSPSVVAREVSSDTSEYSDVFLGMANATYCSWIMDRGNWWVWKRGGGEGRVWNRDVGNEPM